MFTTPVQAVYTRTLTSPRWGLRATGGVGKTRYTVLAGEDRGGGSVIIPGRPAPSFAAQDFASQVALGRVRRDIGSLVRQLPLHRCARSKGEASTASLGPDFEWRPTPQDTVTGQLLYRGARRRSGPTSPPSGTAATSPATPASSGGTGRPATWDYFAARRRALRRVPRRHRLRPSGRLPRASTERSGGPGGRWRSRSRGSAALHHRPAQGGLSRRAARAAGQSAVSGSTRAGIPSSAASCAGARCAAGEQLFELAAGAQVDGAAAPGQGLLRSSPSRGARRRDGLRARPAGQRLDGELTADLQPSDHLQLALSGSRRGLDVDDPASGAHGRLFTADVARLKAVYLSTPAALVAPDRRVRPAPSAIRRSTPSRSTSAAPASPARCSSPTSSTGRRCSSSATATTARSTEAEPRARRAARPSSRSPTLSRDRAAGSAASAGWLRVADGAFRSALRTLRCPVKRALS